jgi:hypothetical protein
MGRDAMTEERKPASARPRGFTNDGKVTSDIVNDSYGTVDPADSTGLDSDLDREEESGDAPARERSNKR